MSSHETFLAPASFAQQRLWFLERLDPGSPVFHVPLAVRLTGALNRRALTASLAAIAARHEILRTTFAIEDGEVTQVIHSEFAVSLREQACEAETLPERLSAEARGSFDLVEGPLWRAVLFRLGEQEHVLQLTLHHIISDGWSLGILIREFSALYAAHLADTTAALPPVDIQYADFATWQREWLQGDVLARQLDFWRRTLAGAPSVLALPTDRPRPAVQTIGGRTHRFEIDGVTTRALHELSRHAGASLFMTLLGGFGVLLRRWSGRDDLVIGTPVANRTRTEVEPLVGFFVNALALRLDLTGDPTIGEFLKRVRHVALEAFAHQDVPFEKLVQELQPERTLGHTPLFQVMFVLQNAPADDLRMPGLTAAPVEVDTATAKYDLTLALQETTTGLIGRLEYNAELFDAATADRLAQHYTTLLRAMVQSASARIGTLRLQSEADERLSLEVGSATTRPYAERALNALFREQVARTPDAIAVKFGAATLSYRELDRRSNQLAHLLCKGGVGADTRVAVCLERSIELVVGLLAIIKAGGAYVALDPEYPAARLALMMEETRGPLLLTQQSLLGKVPAGNARVICVDRDAAEISAQPVTDPEVTVTLEHLAYVSYTSGSTGKPKGVAVPQRGVVRLVQNTDFATFSAGDRFLQLAPIAFDASTLELWAPLLNGGTLVVMPPGTPTLERLGAVIRDEKITTLWLTAGLFHLMVDERLADLGGLKQLLAGGDVLSVSHVRKFLQANPSCRLINGYGPTENTTFTCCHDIRAADLAIGSVPIGRPIANTRVYVLDEALRPVPVGVPGELYTGGDGLARGYLERPELTAEKFVPDPFSKIPGARLYRTGDRVRWRPEGVIEFLGRIDQQVKIRGYRIEPGESEAVLLSEPGVKAAMVVVREAGEGKKQLVGYAVSEHAGEELRRRLLSRLPDYIVPSVIVVLDALPLTPNGKVDRAALPAYEFAATQSYVAPRTPVQEILAILWARVLGVDRVGATDNFFMLGGHSLLATQLVTRIREAFAVELPLRAVFEAPVLGDLATRIEAAKGDRTGGASALRPVARTTDLPLSYAQERLWFLNELEPGNPFYNMPAAQRLRGKFDLESGERVVRELVRRHESLRTIFSAVDGKPVQKILPDITVPVTLIDLQAIAADQQVTAIGRATAEEARRPFDLARGPLLRVVLLRLAPDDHILLMTMHHIVSDGWSMGVLTREMGELYAAFSEQRSSPLPGLGIQYADFAVWQRQWLRGDVLRGQLDYWKQQLAGAPPVLKLPTDRPRPPVQSFRGSSQSFLIGRALADRVSELSRKSGTTLFMTLEVAFAALLSRYCDQQDVVIGTPIANRHRAEVEPLIGFFVNTLVLRNDLSGRPSFRELLNRVRRCALDAYAHQDLPFERLVDELQPERDLSRNPVFQVMFALHNTPHRERVHPQLTITELPAERLSAQFDLVLDVWPTSEGFKAVLEYASDLFDPATISRLIGHWEMLLTAAVENPDAPVDELPLVTPAERVELLDAFNATAMEYPHDRTTQQLIEAQALATPERIAGVHQGRQLTYAKLNAEANRLARHLQSLGVGRGSFVGILDERGLDFLTAMVAILKAGAAFIPIDPGYPEERVRYMISNSEVATLISRGSVLARLSLADAGDALQNVVLFDEGAGATADAARRFHSRSSWQSHSAENLGIAGDSTDAAYMLYTSGSTGLPKGAIIRHNGAVNHIYGQFRDLEFHAGTAFLQSAPSSSDISVWQFLAPLLIGGRTVIADFETVCDAAKLFRLIRDERITLIELVPVVLKELLDHAAAQSATGRELPDLEFAMVTGEAVSVALVNQWFATYPKLRLVNAYGPTEAADDICQAVLTGPLPPATATVPIGKPLGNLTLYVLDRHLQLVPIGVPGEICVSGVGVGVGYWRNEEKTRAAFVPNPHHEGRRGEVIYRTGDLGRWLPNGNLEMLGRFDQQVKLRGFRIELGEIESMLSQHPAVAETVVQILEDGAGDKRLVAYVTADDAGQGLSEKVATLATEQVQLWQTLHEDSYSDTLTYADADRTFNVIGWDSNYTGEPLSETEMREYVGHTIDRVRELNPRRVLEIGCGTGLLLFRLAPHLEHYLCTDLSEVAIAQLVQLKKELPGYEHVEFRAQRADDFSGMTPGRYDVVMLCSVVQYFPGIEYLLGVIEGALRLLRPGGTIFLGDVRVRALLPAFHTGVQLFKADDTLTSASLRRRVRAAAQREQEMAIDPAFFAALRQRFPQIAEVQVRPKRGTVHNEMTRFRCDVTLRLKDETASAPRWAGVWRDWQDEPATIAQLRTELASGVAASAWRNVTNARVEHELRAVRWLERAPATQTVAEFRRGIEVEPRVGWEPEELYALGAELGYQVDAALSADGASFDVVFRVKRGASAAALSPVEFSTATALPRPWRTYANNPLHEKLARELVPQLRGFLRERLPTYMVPSDFVVLEAMPQLPNGKVDRQGLPAPEASSTAEQDFVAPRTPAEAKVAAIWATVLGLERVSVTANFFELGGHSLKATQVVSRIQKELGVEIALREMFSQPTVAELAHATETRRRTAYEPLPHVPIAEHYALSHAQLRLWVLSQMEAAMTAYNMPISVRLEGAINSVALERAFLELAHRHESLRTTFIVVDGVPRQRIHPAPLGEIECIDVSTEADPEARARMLATEHAQHAFDLEHGPLLRVSLLKLEAYVHVLLFNVHHIVSDDWSMGVLVKEFIRLHDSFASGEEPSLPPLTVQYRDYAGWQNARLLADGMTTHRDYWRNKFAGEVPVLNLPVDFPRPPVKTYHGRTRAFSWPAQLVDRLHEVAGGQQASLFMVLTAAVQTLLHRYTDQRDIIVGCPIAGRNHPDLEDQIGFYVNTLPLRAQIDPAEAFTSLLQQVRVNATEAYEHQAYPFDRLVDDLALARDVTRSPLFDVVVVMQNVDAYALALDGVTVKPFVDDFGASKFDLQFNFQEVGGDLAGSLVFNPDLFTDERIARMVAHLQTLVESIAADPSQPIGRLNLLSGDERRRVLTTFNGVAAEYPRGHTLVSWFEAQVARTPSAGALSCDEKTLSYAELNAASNRLAHRLRELGVGPGARVGMYFERSLEMVVGLLAVVKAGGAYVPFDPVYPPERIGFMLADSKPLVLLSHRGMADRLPAHGAAVVCFDRDAAILAAGSAKNLPPTAGPDDAAYIIYTSGSTGRPKGCIIPHYQVVRLFEATQGWFRFNAQDVWTLFHSYAFDFSVWEIWGALLYGGRLVVVPHAVSREPEAFLRLLAHEGVTVLNQTPSAFRQLIAADEAIAAEALQLRLRTVVFGGEALDIASLRPWWERHGDQQPQLVNMYGITETTVHVTYRPLSKADLAGGRSVIGCPIPDLRLYLLDNYLQPVAIGVVGEIFVGGAGVAQGYLDRPELTAQRFIPDPFASRAGATLYRSGDLARWLPNGDVEYLGRADDQVKIRGFRIELGEIEGAFMSHPAVREALVLVREDSPGDKRLAAYLVLRDPAATIAELREHVRTRVPDYMVPAGFVVLDAIPLTPNGKADRRALPAPESVRTNLEVFAAPRDDLEQAIARLWCDALGVERVGRDDSFFDLGGHSLLVVQVHKRLRAELAREFSVVELFKHATVGSLAEFLRAKPGATDAVTDEARERARKQQEARSRRRPGVRQT